MRFAETESQYASKDREVVVKEPVIHTITLPEENIPEGITVLECPETMTEGRTFTIRLQLPENTLIKNIGYSYKAGEWTATSAFSGVQHMQEDGHTVAVLQRDALSHDITIHRDHSPGREVLYSDRRPGGYRVGIAFYPV